MTAGELTEVAPFAKDRVVEAAFVCRGRSPGESCLIAALSARDAVDASKDEVWSYSLATRDVRRISNGGGLTPSPDRTRVAFLRSDGAGFHRFEWCELSSGRVQPVISLWEADPCSGTSFDCIWSANSKVLRITGDGLGFRERRGSSTEYDLAYFADEDVMVSLR